MKPRRTAGQCVNTLTNPPTNLPACGGNDEMKETVARNSKTLWFYALAYRSTSKPLISTVKQISLKKNKTATGLVDHLWWELGSAYLTFWPWVEVMWRFPFESFFLSSSSSSSWPHCFCTFIHSHPRWGFPDFVGRLVCELTVTSRGEPPRRRAAHLWTDRTPQSPSMAHHHTDAPLISYCVRETHQRGWRRGRKPAKGEDELQHVDLLMIY